MPARTYSVYILASVSRRLYVGVTSDLSRRLHQHATGAIPGYTRRYNITTLVHVETFAGVRDAIAREKQLKRRPRWRKDRLIANGAATWRSPPTGDG